MTDKTMKMGFEAVDGPKDSFRDLITTILKERFPEGFNFTDIIVERRTSHDGESYIHTYIVFEGDIRKFDPAKTLGISTMLWPRSREMGYEAIPIQSFVEKSEWAAVNG